VAGVVPGGGGMFPGGGELFGLQKNTQKERPRKEGAPNELNKLIKKRTN